MAVAVLRRTRVWRGPAVVATVLLAASAVPATARPQAWTASAMTRVFPADPAPPAGAGAGTARLAAARGETESFQVVVRAGEGGEALGDVTVGVTELLGPGGASIKAGDLTLYRAHHVQVRRPSPAPAGGGEAAPTGPYPDALIPFLDPATGREPKGGRHKGQPFAVEAGSSQPVWVDVAVPRDLPPGTYRGGWWVRSAQGRAGGQVELTVWRATLPETPGLRSSVNQWNDHSLAADRVLVENKVMPLWVDPAGARKLKGKGPLNAAGLGFWSGAEPGNCRTGRPPGAAQMAQRAAAFPEGLLLYNLTADGVAGCPDEVAGPLREWSRSLHAAGVANLVVGAPDPRLAQRDGGDEGRPPVDIWAVGPGTYHGAADRVRAAIDGGAQAWATTALGGHDGSPAWLLDRPPIGYRILPGYMAQGLGFTGLLYWAADFWSADPWDDVEYRSEGGGTWPGEGLLVYPGGPAGVAGVVPSIRLKLVRDGVEDFDLIALAREAGLPGLARELEAVGGRDWRGWTADPAVLEASRRRIGEALEGR